VMNSGTSEAEF